MNRIEVINNFIRTFRNLSFQDKEGLENFRLELNKTIAEIYGPQSSYRTDLEKIRFTPRSFYTTEEDLLESWSLGINNVVKLLEAIRLEEEMGPNEISSERHDWSSEDSEEPSIAPVSPEGASDFDSGSFSKEPSLEHSQFSDSPIITDENHSMPEFSPEMENTAPSKKGNDSLSDYILELEFSPGSEINIDAMQNIDSREAPLNLKETPAFLPEPTHSMDKKATPAAPESSPESNGDQVVKKDPGQKTKIQQLESTIEKIKRNKIKELTISGLKSTLEKRSGLEADHLLSSNIGNGNVPYASGPVFVTYGYNEMIKDEVASTLEKLEIPVILRKKLDDEEKTIIKNFLDLADIGFAIVVLSGDDFGYPKDHESHQAKLRARQQVVFELGFLIGKLGREKVFVLHQDSKNFEFPTGFFDVIYTPYSKLGGWQIELLRQLKHIGYKVDANRLI